MRSPILALIALTFLTTSRAGSAQSTTQCSASFIEQLRAYVFPVGIATEGYSQALVYRDTGYQFSTLEEINRFNVTSQHFVEGTRHVLALRYSPLESPYWSYIESADGANSFLLGLGELVATRCNPSNTQLNLRFPDIKSKSMAQRDAYQTFSLVWFAKAKADTNQQPLADKLLSRFAQFLDTLKLSEREYAELLSLRPKAPDSNFTTTLNYSLEQNYLPIAALRPDPEWLLLSNRGHPFRHFAHYRGRSFVKVYVRASNASASTMSNTRSNLFSEYGQDLHLSAVSEEVPKGMQTMLLRTYGVFLADGSFRDSFWPEEVLIRAFKYPRRKVDLRSSDFRGTFTFQYHLSRELMMAKGGSIGLNRVMDDEEQFFGFHGDSPDPRNSLANTTTTMRVNCIGCHSELFYGLSTVFSFERNPRWESESEDNEFSKSLGQGSYRLITDEALGLEVLLRQQRAN